MSDLRDAARWHIDNPNRPNEGHVRLREALAAPQPEPPLDVERLARALQTVNPPSPSFAEYASGASGIGVDWQSWAHAIAAAYRATEEGA